MFCPDFQLFVEPADVISPDISSKLPLTYNLTLPAFSLVSTVSIIEVGLVLSVSIIVEPVTSTYSESPPYQTLAVTWLEALILISNFLLVVLWLWATTCLTSGEPILSAIICATTDISVVQAAVGSLLTPVLHSTKSSLPSKFKAKPASPSMSYNGPEIAVAVPDILSTGMAAVVPSLPILFNG